MCNIEEASSNPTRSFIFSPVKKFLCTDMTENSRKTKKMLIFVQLRKCTHVHVITRVVASKARLLRLRAKVACPTFLVYEQLQCYHVYICIYFT